MGKRIEYEVGHKFDGTRLTYLRECEQEIVTSRQKTVKKRIAEFLCDCGNHFQTRIESVKGKQTTSCGCRKREITIARSTTHGEARSRLNRIYGNMLTRCYNENSPSYHYYGNRGISVCAEWRTDYVNFSNWAKANGYQEHLTLEREDNELDYCPSNCVWRPDKLKNLTEGSTLQHWNTSVVNIVTIDNKSYPSIAEAVRQTGLTLHEMRKRCDSDKFQNYSRRLRYED